MSLTFKANLPFFNSEELTRLISSVYKGAISGDKIEINIDLGAYKYLGLNETLILLLMLRDLTGRILSKKHLKLPLSEGPLKFLERWNFFDEIFRFREEYFINSMSVGNSMIDQALVDLKKHRRSEETVSMRMLEINRIKEMNNVFSYIKDLHQPSMKSILVNQLRKSPDEVTNFVEKIMFELLTNIIHHVIAYEENRNIEDAEPTLFEKYNRRVGFVALQTHTKEFIDKNGMEYYQAIWPDFIRSFISKCANGLVEISIVDDGAGMLDTLKDYFEVMHKGEKKLTSNLEAIKFACTEGISRYNSMMNEDVVMEYMTIFESIKNEPKENLPALLQSHINKLTRESKSPCPSGYGLSNALSVIEEWGGIMLIRSGDAYYCPGRNIYIDQHEEVLPYSFPGVQIQVLLPRGL